MYKSDQNQHECFLQLSEGSCLCRCESVNAETLLSGADDILTAEFFTFPSLHIMLAITNKLVQELESQWSDFHLWPESLHIVREDYFGKCFEVGNTQV